MEGNIDSRQWGGSKATIKLDITLRFLLGLRTFGALRDDITEHLSTLKVRQLLHLEIIQDVCHCLQSYQFTSTDILLTLDIVIDDLKKRTGADNDAVKNLMKSWR
jgi:hypothetical protein